MKLPDKGQPVVAKVHLGGSSFIHLIATYVGYLEEEIQFLIACEGEMDYDEETDTYYWPQGWYEFSYYANGEEQKHWLIHGTVVGWSEIPNMTHKNTD